MSRPPPCSTLFPYTTLFRSLVWRAPESLYAVRTVPEVLGPHPAGLGPSSLEVGARPLPAGEVRSLDRKSTRLNSSHVEISYAVFCLKKKTSWPRGIVLVVRI